METVRLVIELKVEDYMYNREDSEEKEWFYDNILGVGSEPIDDLFLFSNEIGDSVGDVRVISVVEVKDGSEEE